jgi:uncharacterized protein (TIGR00369 family)
MIVAAGDDMGGHMTDASEALRQALTEATGAQLLQGMAERRVPYPEHYEPLGLRVARAVKDRVELTWTPTVSLTNYAGAVHGGHTAMVFDEACCGAGVSGGERFYPMTTLSLTVDYLRAVRPDQTYAVLGEVVHAGRSRLLVNATIRDRNGDLIAQARATVLPDKGFSTKAFTEREAAGATERE